MLICNTLSIHAFDQAFQAEFAIDNALHGYDLPYYFPDVGKLFAKSYNNTDFDTAFASAFTNFILAKDPNVKVAADITPAWPTWSNEAPLEMVFNKTGDGVPDIQVKNVDSKLLERCRYVYPRPPVQEDAYDCTVTGRASRLQSGSKVDLGAPIIWTS